ncbi:MAG: hypothetical protein H5T62_09520 [Anaerolineae bacterium]|nr:hypothetical protein [Anaerolineae bacterium]
MAQARPQLSLDTHVAAARQRLGDSPWLPVLEVFLPTGLADSSQIQRATGFSEDKVRRLLQELTLSPDPRAPRILIPVSAPLHRAGRRGRPPLTHKLGPLGAALLRSVGHSEARACHLEGSVPLSHAWATLELRLAARNARLPVDTEREVHIGQQTLRPDNLVTLAPGVRALYEVEQEAQMHHLRRIIDGLRRKAAAFSSPHDQGFSPNVRLLFNFARRRDYHSSLEVWTRALAAVAEEHGGTLPFRLLARPHDDFLAHPDRSEPPGEGWTDLFDPARLSSFAPAPQPQQTAITTRQRLANLPKAIEHRLSPGDDVLVLRAFWQVFRERGLVQAAFPPADPAFFQVMNLIRGASLVDDDTPLQQAALPRMSLLLLAQFLRMHPQLKQALQHAMQRGQAHSQWGVTTIKHHMQQVIRVFLRYFGFTPDGPLVVYVAAPPWDEEAPQEFHVVARIRHAALLLPEGAPGPMPTKEEVRYAEESLAWVLQALFLYPDLLELGPGAPYMGTQPPPKKKRKK